MTWAGRLDRPLHGGDAHMALDANTIITGINNAGFTVDSQ